MKVKVAQLLLNLEYLINRKKKLVKEYFEMTGFGFWKSVVQKSTWNIWNVIKNEFSRPIFKRNFMLFMGILIA